MDGRIYTSSGTEVYEGTGRIGAACEKIAETLQNMTGTGGTGSGKGEGLLHPEDFGAAGDGITDDRTALLAAMKEAAESGVPLDLTVGAVYRYTSMLEVPSDLTIRGHGAVLLSDIQYDRLGSDRLAIFICGDSNSSYRHDIRLEDIVFRAADTCQTNYMLRFMRARDCYVKDCIFDCEMNDYSRCVADIYGAGENITFDHVIFRQLTAYKEGGLWVRDWSNMLDTRNIRFLNCIFYKAGGDEVLAVWGWSGHVRDVLISGCSFYEVDDEKYTKRGYFPEWFITLGQSGYTEVRMEHCFIRVKRAETIFRMVRDTTHTVVDNCDIYLDQPDDMPIHDPTKTACAMLAQGNGLPDGSTLFSNNRIHFRGDEGRKICYKVGALRNNFFDVEGGVGPASTYEVTGNTFRGKFSSGLFWDCSIVRNNIADFETGNTTWVSGADEVTGNDVTMTIPGDVQGAAVFKNNWGSGAILNNRLNLDIGTECDIRLYNFPAKNTVPQYIQNNIVTITGKARYNKLENVLEGTVYRKNNYFNGIPERLFECTGVTFEADSIVEEFRKYRTLGVTITPETCTDPIIYTWDIPEGVLEDRGYGRYRPLKDGTANVTVNCGMFEASQEIQVKLVPTPCTSVKLTRTTALCGEGRSTYLKAFIEPYWATDMPVWTSSATDIAEVTQDGEVKAKKIGSATITVTCGKQSASCALTVVDAASLPTYKEGEWLLDGTVAYMPLPNLQAEHSVWMYFDIDTDCVGTSEEVIAITTGLSGQSGSTPISLGFGKDKNSYPTVRWYTTDVDADEDGNTTLYYQKQVNYNFKDVASSDYVYLKDGVATKGGSIVWASFTKTVKAGPNNGILSFNVDINDTDKPVTDYKTAAALKAALTAGEIHATKATGLKLQELIVFANSIFENKEDFYKYRENAEIDLRFDENGNVLNAGTGGEIIWAK